MTSPQATRRDIAGRGSAIAATSAEPRVLRHPNCEWLAFASDARYLSHHSELRPAFEELAADEEGHVDFLETQLELIKQVGIQLYMQKHIGELDD